ncbi:MAG TPA: sigma-70 family RNA polymerase sigma factor, partial [Tepidisphaeraceae bacterium]
MTTVQSDMVLAGPGQADERADLRRYAASGDADAFARLVQRYVHIVYTLCIRQLGDRHLAEDVTQGVFILLARKARSIAPGVILSGWLFDAARYCCANARRASERRMRHESEAAKQRPETVDTATQSLESDEIGQALHGALGRMRLRDRQVLMLRYFEQRSFRDVGRALGVTEDAAKHRLSRALEKLRGMMLRKETISAALVAQVPQWLEGHVLCTAPAGLAQTAATAAMSTMSASASAVSIAKAASVAMGWAQAKMVAVAAAVLIACGGGAILVTQEIQSSSAATAPAATTEPAVAQLDRSDPLACLHSLSKSLSDLDEAGVRQCLVLPDDALTAKMIMTGMKLDMTQLRLERVLTDRFGPDARKAASITEMPTNRLIDEGLGPVQPGDVQIDGDHAVYAVRLNPAVQDKVPELAVLKFVTIPMYFTRDASGGWRLDILASVGYLTLDTNGGYHRADPRVLIQQYGSIIAGAEDTIGEVGA